MVLASQVRAAGAYDVYIVEMTAGLRWRVLWLGERIDGSRGQIEQTALRVGRVLTSRL